jgi:hypothetical protein
MINDEYGKAGHQLRYETSKDMVVFNEQLRWTKFYNSLVFNSILLLGWATIYAGSDKAPLKSFVLVLICVLGAGLSIFWGALGRRTSEYLDLFHYDALETEKKLIGNGPFYKAEHMETKTKAYQSSRNVVTYVPYIIGVFYLVLIPVSLWSVKMDYVFIIACESTEKIINNIGCYVIALAVIIAVAVVILKIFTIFWQAKKMKHEALIGASKNGHKEIVEKLLSDLKGEK